MKILKDTKKKVKNIPVKLDLIDGERIDVWVISYPKNRFKIYEYIHANPLSCLQQVFNFIDENHKIPLSVLENTVEFSSFKNMKKMEKAGSVSSSSHFTDNIQDQESYKVRKGKIGGYVEYLSAEDIDFIDQVLQEMNYPFIHKKY